MGLFEKLEKDPVLSYTKNENFDESFESLLSEIEKPGEKKSPDISEPEYNESDETESPNFEDFEDEGYYDESEDEGFEETAEQIVQIFDIAYGNYVVARFDKTGEIKKYSSKKEQKSISIPLAKVLKKRKIRSSPEGELIFAFITVYVVKTFFLYVSNRQNTEKQKDNFSGNIITPNFSEYSNDNNDKPYNVKGNTKCGYCGQRGHNKVTCPKRKADRKNGKS